jgi:hypothetical protein
LPHSQRGHDITVPARFRAQNAEAILDIVVGDALDETGQRLGGGDGCHR